VLHVIVAILSLLLLAGTFGRGMDTGDEGTPTPAGNRDVGADDFEGPTRGG
jgi:hypothetical protein